jgi:hypothetical protein
MGINKMTNRKADKTIEFESDTHITKEEAFDVAHAMFETLHGSCPGCTMGIISMLVSILVVNYMKNWEAQKEIFDYEDWIEYMVKMSKDAIERYEQTGTTVQ